MTAVSTRTSPDLALFDAAGPELAAHFAENGFALLRNALSPAEVAEINDEALRICRGDYGEITYGPLRRHRLRHPSDDPPPRPTRSCCGSTCASTTRTSSRLRPSERCTRRRSSTPWSR